MKLMLSDVLSRDLMRNLDIYVRSITKASMKFTEAVRLLNDIRIGEARVAFKQVIDILNESNILKSTIEEEIAKISLDPGFKEELLFLINLVDDVGDYVKEASREFTILPFLELPIQLRNGLLNLSSTVSDMVSMLSEAFMAFARGEYELVEKILKNIVELEERADNIEIENRSSLLTISDRLKPIAIQLLVHDLNNILENTADLCTGVIRRMKLLYLTWLS